MLDIFFNGHWEKRRDRMGDRPPPPATAPETLGKPAPPAAPAVAAAAQSTELESSSSWTCVFLFLGVLTAALVFAGMSHPAVQGAACLKSLVSWRDQATQRLRSARQWWDDLRSVEGPVRKLPPPQPPHDPETTARENETPAV